MAALTPMMQQYMAIKEQYKDCILFYRLGDFYEMFYDDALTASRELEITLTGKNCGQEERAPMCGVPYHAVDVYLNKLVAKGYKVAICEQAEDPKQAKGIVKREVIRIVTPGTNLSQQALDEGRNNYLMCLVYDNNQFGLAITDISTGDFYTTEVATLKELYDEIHRFSPSEIICNDSFYMSGASLDDFKDRLHVSVSTLDTWYMDEAVSVQKIKEHFKVASLDGLGLTDFPSGTLAVGALLLYLYETQKNTLDNLTKITPYRSGGYMIIDSATNRNLELIETLREKQKKGSLLWVLDKTKTAMGARLMRNWIEQPLIEKKKITARQDAVEELYNDMITREEIREYLNAVYDLERLVTRISYRTANPRDLIAFKTSLGMIPPVKQLLSQAKSAELKEIDERMDCLEDIYDLIEKSIQDEPPIMIREGGMIKEGYNEDVDKFRLSRTEGKTWLAELEAREKEKTGIKNLRVRYNKVFGYYLEVTNSYKELVPEDWTRKQTLANAERYITPELKELEDMILGAEDKLAALEYDLYCEVRDSIGEQVVRIQETAKAIAHLDVLASLACVAQSNDYVRPSINTKGVIDIQGGRHPVVEKMNNNQMFIDNDTYLDNKNHRISIITGPNMAGKSTYMRQSALIVLMAQIGSFVPAKSANIGIVDRIFTRVGASDDLASGQSTFMVEMTEVANILRNATSRSLLILDEIGRGTSTFDGLSIAWAVVEHISNPKLLGAKTLFATHYHELTALSNTLTHLVNVHVATLEKDGEVTFLHKIVDGPADKSYGIHVAKIAGLPVDLLERADTILTQLEGETVTIQPQEKVSPQEKPATETHVNEQISLFDDFTENPVLQELRDLDIYNMTPMQVMMAVADLKQKL